MVLCLFNFRAVFSRFINAETSELSLDDSDVKDESESPPEQSESNSAAPIALTDSQAAELGSWFMGVLSDKLISAKVYSSSYNNNNDDYFVRSCSTPSVSDLFTSLAFAAWRK